MIQFISIEDFSFFPTLVKNSLVVRRTQ